VGVGADDGVEGHQSERGVHSRGSNECIAPRTDYLSVVGMDVIAAPLKRSPRTATFPMAAVKLAEPRLPDMGPNPGRSLKKNALLPFAGREMLVFPILAPVLSRTTIETDVDAELRLTTATPVLKAVSSQIRVLVVADMPDSGTTAS